MVEIQAANASAKIQCLCDQHPRSLGGLALGSADVHRAVGFTFLRYMERAASFINQHLRAVGYGQHALA
ncbi:hypothetical protein D3C85_1703600 [compost metagenome]